MSVVVDPTFDLNSHTIISLEALLKRDDETLSQITEAFTSRGWCIVRLPASIDFLTASEDIEDLKTFFKLPENKKVHSFGFSAVPHKQSVHIITPNILINKENINSNIKPIMEHWIEIWDQTTTTLLDILAEEIFHVSTKELITKAHLPSSLSGMIDVAYYENQQTVSLSPQIGFSTDDVNCVPHFDPGLLSISFLSTHDGLQLQDPKTETWFAGPVNTREGESDLGVIWLGSAAVYASGGAFKAGVHRVVYPQVAKPRIAAWYEICTVDQIDQEINDTPVPDSPVLFPNLPGSHPLDIKGNKKALEQIYGVPPSKVLFVPEISGPNPLYEKEEKGKCIIL